jgi:hypothetical protein
MGPLRIVGGRNAASGSFRLDLDEQRNAYSSAQRSYGRQRKWPRLYCHKDS